MSSSTLQQILLHPTGWKVGSDFESKRYPLSLMGHVMPKIYVLVSEVFALPELVDTQANEAITENLKAGLEFAISRFPILAGHLEMDAVSGRMWVSTTAETKVHLHVKHMLGEEDFPSYSELACKDFPAGLLKGHQLLPESVTAKQLHSPLGDNNEDGIAAAAFQLNFIRGGLIIAMAVHHSVSDGPGCDGFLSTWAENSVAALNGTPFIPNEIPFSLHGTKLDVEGTISPEQMKELQEALPVVRDAGGPMQLPPADFKMPALVSHMWHFPKSKTELLKATASGSGDANWISTYDAIMAVLWSSITRAKIDLLQPNESAKATLVHAVDTRKVWSPPLSERFLGVGATAARCEPLSVQELIAAENLSKVAATVRSSIKAVTPDHLRRLLQWVEGHEDKRWLEISINSFLGLDLGASSWQGMKAYEKHDFGFGLPKALRWPSPPFEGFVFLYPSRAGVEGAEEDEGIEVCVCLEESCHNRLMEDQVLLEYAQLRGLE
ncbi:unnamed protein product [Clonostachys rosea f. rosea IK726]|uniref:Uncharacterized protein n=1 Tax=Clonostachys rosea f. rosea IK726 TaxID=1349383 RepID=A0ACA9TWF6_BIOOC|nr:unnamed protein product [Clonostachys rosea f. rosea IK726]